jgi:hypothetical protein
MKFAKNILKIISTVATTLLILRAQPCVEECIEPMGIISIEFSGEAPLSNHNGIRIFSWEL